MRKLKKSLSIAAGIFSLLGLGLVMRTNNAIKKSEKKFPPLGKFSNIQGCSIHYFTEGKGPVIVLLHGENGDIYDFYLSSLWKKLKEKFQLVAIDRPGNGYSRRVGWKDYGFRNQGEIIHQTIQALGLKDPLLIGYGESTGIILSMLMEHEESYKGAVLIEDKVSGQQEVKDKIISLPVIGKFLLWTVVPLVAGFKSNTKNSEKKISGEYIHKTMSFDTHPFKLLNSSENKKFLQIEELKKLCFIHTNIKKPVTIIHSASSKENGSLASELKLENIISDLNIISIPESENFMSLTGSDIVIDEINKIGQKCRSN